jgi:hypothetical protein
MMWNQFALLVVLASQHVLQTSRPLRVAYLLIQSESNVRVSILIFFISGSCELLRGERHRINDTWSRRMNHCGSRVVR